MAVLLDNPVRSYAWGSPTVIPDLLGRQPTGRPEAELWVGAHAGSPSTVVGDGRSLDRYVADDPAAALGPAVVERFGPKLPFLLKILAVEQPLSIQVHPTIEQATEGYAAEDAAGIALEDPRRSYRDRNHKPEMVVALTDFEALLGFDDPLAVAEALETCDDPDLAGAGAVLRTPGGLEQVVRRWLTLGDDQAAEIVSALVSAASAHRDDPRFGLVTRLAQAYPHDRGLLLALLMRLVRLAPGEAAFVPAGVPHAYLSGVAVEPQASSDNTLRAGLTPKHVDVVEVQRLLRYEPGGALMVTPKPAGAEDIYPVPGVDELLLSRAALTAATALPVPGPRLVLVVEGNAVVSGGDAVVGGEVTLRRGQAAFVPATETGATLHGDGVAFTLTTALDEAR